jgi:hypothetical protein
LLAACCGVISFVASKLFETFFAQKIKTFRKVERHGMMKMQEENKIKGV